MGAAMLVGQPADIAPSAYQYRADRKAEENPPESWIGLMKFANLPFGTEVNASDPRFAQVLCSLIWEEVRPVRRVTLTWNDPARPRPRPEEVVVTYFDGEAEGNIPTWWNPAATGQADAPEVTADGRSYAFTIPVDTFGVVVRVQGQRVASSYEVPLVQALVADRWKRMEVEIEWGFDDTTSASDYSGRIEAYDGIVDGVRPFAGDTGTTMKGPTEWQSVPVSSSRRGIRLGLCYLGTTRDRRLWPYNAEADDVARTIVTVWTNAGSFSLLASDLEKGPILAPEYGFFVRACMSLPNTGDTSVEEMLDEKVDELPGVPKVCGWAIQGMPWFGVNSTSEAGSAGSLTVPARSAAMHPAPDRDVAIGWCSPIEGLVSVSGRLAMGDSKGGNGVEWSMTQQGQSKGQTLVRGAIDPGGFVAIGTAGDAEKLARIPVKQGDMLSLAASPKEGNHICDTTIVEFEIAEVGGKQRVWNLTRDVVDSVHAGNPHSDAAGNRGVWRFYAAAALVEPAFRVKSNAGTAKEFLAELAARDLQTTRQRVREHPEQTWEGAIGGMFSDQPLPEINKPEFEPPMKVEVPCARITAQWKLGAWHLVRHAVKNDKGKLCFNDHPYGILASETYLVLHALDLMGMHEEAADGLDQWLGLPVQNEKPVGLFSDGNGCLTNAEGPPGIGGNMDGIHAMGPGAIMLSLVEHFRLTGDTDWLRANAPRMKANIEWILRQRRLLAGSVPGGDRLWCRGLQPPHQVTPDSGGQLMQFYESEAYYWLAVRQFADILAPIDSAEAERLAAEAETYRRDLQAAAERSFALSPVVLVRDGTYRSFLPFACYVRGFASGAWSWRRPGSGAHVGGLYWDTIQSAEPLVSPAGILAANDPRVQGTLDVLEDRLLLENPKVAQRTGGYDPEEDWFARAAWQYQPGLERHADIHLAGDDPSSFLRSWLNQYAVLILPDQGYTFREHTTGGPPDKIFEEAAFLERFRQMLVMEEGDCLWIGRAAPRAWLRQGERITVENAPTRFGTVSYQITSSAEDGKIRAVVEMPSRGGQKAVLLRLRHPGAAPIEHVTVNGQPWQQFDRDKEAVCLEQLAGTVTIEVAY